MEFSSPHKYIKNTSANEKVLTGQLLNTCGRPQTSERTTKILMPLGRMKERRGEVGRDYLVSPCRGGWMLEWGVWRADQWRGRLLDIKRQPEGMGVRSSHHFWQKKPGLSWKQGATHKAGGGGCHCNPLPHPLAPASTINGRRTHLRKSKT